MVAGLWWVNLRERGFLEVLGGSGKITVGSFRRSVFDEVSTIF